MKKIKAIFVLLGLFVHYIFEHWKKKMTIITLVVFIGGLGLFLYSYWGMLGPKPTVVIVSYHPHNPHSNGSSINDVKITNTRDVRAMYRILIRSPHMPKGPISCPMDTGDVYRLTFKSKYNKTVVTVDPYGCENINIGTYRHHTFMRDKKADEFWYLLAKNLNIDVEKISS